MQKKFEIERNANNPVGAHRQHQQGSSYHREAIIKQWKTKTMIQEASD